MTWALPVTSLHEKRIEKLRRKWREAQRRHRSGQSMSRSEAAKLATQYRMMRKAA